MLHNIFRFPASFHSVRPDAWSDPCELIITGTPEVIIAVTTLTILLDSSISSLHSAQSWLSDILSRHHIHASSAHKLSMAIPHPSFFPPASSPITALFYSSSAELEFYYHPTMTHTVPLPYTCPVHSPFMNDPFLSLCIVIIPCFTHPAQVLHFL